MTPVTPWLRHWRELFSASLVGAGWFTVLAVASFLSGGTSPQWFVGLLEVCVAAGWAFVFVADKQKQLHQQLIDLQQEHIADLELALEARHQLLGGVTATTGTPVRMAAGDTLKLNLVAIGHSIELHAVSASSIQVGAVT